MKRITYIAISLILFLFSCKKDIDKIVELFNSPPGDFTVTVVIRNETTSEIKWERAIDVDGDSVSYKVELNGEIIVSNLTTTNYKFSGLLADSTYNGRVIAIDAKGLQTSSRFTIVPIKDGTPQFEQILIGESHYGGLHSYNLTNFTSWTAGSEVMTIPAVNKDTIFCGARDEIFAVSSINGKVFWKKEIRQNDFTSLVYYKGKLFLNSYDKIYALNSSNGAILWSIPGVARRDLTVNDNVLFSITYPDMNAIDINTGTIKWKSPLIASFVSAPVAKNGILYLIHTTSSGNQGYLQALDVQNGTQKWVFKFIGQSLNVEGSGSPAIYEDLIYFPSVGNDNISTSTYIYAINIKNGMLAWQKKLDIYGNLKTISADDSGIYTSSPERIIKLNRTNGNVLWSQNGDFASTLTLASSKIYINLNPMENIITTYSSTTGLKVESLTKKWGFFNSPVVIKNGKVYYPSNGSMSKIN